jgi:hypothetical protein
MMMWMKVRGIENGLFLFFEHLQTFLRGLKFFYDYFLFFKGNILWVKNKT